MNIIFNQFISKKPQNKKLLNILILISLIVFLKPNFAITSDEANYFGFALKKFSELTDTNSVYNFKLYSFFIIYDFIVYNLIKFFGINIASFIGKILIVFLIFYGVKKLFIHHLKLKPYQILFGICAYYSLVWYQSYFALANFTYQGFVPNSLGMPMSFFVIYYFLKEKILKLLLSNSILLYTHFELGCLISLSLFISFFFTKKIKIKNIFLFTTITFIILIPIFTEIFLSLINNSTDTSAEIYLDRAKHHFFADSAFIFFNKWFPGILLCLFNSIVLNTILSPNNKKFLIIHNCILLVVCLGFVANYFVFFENIFFFRLNSLLFFMHIVLILSIFISEKNFNNFKVINIILIFIIFFSFFKNIKNSTKNYINYFDKNNYEVINLIKNEKKLNNKYNLNFSSFDMFELLSNKPFFVEKKFSPHHFKSLIDWKKRIVFKEDFYKSCQESKYINIIIYNINETKLCGKIILKNKKFIVTRI